MPCILSITPYHKFMACATPEQFMACATPEQLPLICQEGTPTATIILHTRLSLPSTSMWNAVRKQVAGGGGYKEKEGWGAGSKEK